MSPPGFLVIGQILRPHGVRGEVRVTPHTDQPERFTWLKSVYLGMADPQPVEVESVRFHAGQGLVLLKLVGYNSREAADQLRGQWLQVREEDAISLAEGEYFLYQLEGLAVYGEDGRYLGNLTEVIETGANHVFVVQGAMGEILLPNIPEVIQDIDFAAGSMTVHLLPGLLVESGNSPNVETSG
jgi:16S rRNA processing protein RimM